MRYLEGLIQIQLKKLKDYEYIKKAFQMIIYIGKLIGKFQDYVHEIQKGDIE